MILTRLSLSSMQSYGRLSFPTRENAILDKIMTDISSFYYKPSKIPHLGKSDHYCVLLPLNLQLLAPKAYRKSVRPITDSGKCSFGQWITCEGWEEVYTTEGAEEKAFLVSARDLACQQEVSLALTKIPPIHYYNVVESAFIA